MTAKITNLNSSILLLTDNLYAQQASLDLQTAGYQPILEKVQKGWTKLSLHQPVMLIVDRALTGQLGFNLCHQLREAGERIPILMLVEQETVEERVACLEAGADDYLLKSYHREKLLEQINLYLQAEVDIPEQLRFGELVLDLTTRQIIRTDKVIDLTMKEFELLKYLMSNPQQVMTREEIIENVWGYDYRGESNVIEVYIRYLRLKIESQNKKRLIQTVRGIGYVLRES
ncbi:response regulator transcription factor [Waterburya agarophytonicola K14]|uniref:Response regulator transcription factor n=1 Tax=Waterburya agarophytonicola KI4 TaxID=2874699 RepID=A0A964BU05_9CYAN|nr:response regulator transcription factor [Waterburya agarophytonicola]MCC0179094.1 response regulator transcription factor [Waterburya agarophytonicola KI4]